MHDVARTEAPSTDLSVVDMSNPRSVIRLVPSAVAAAVGDHVFTNPELFDRDEKDLYAELKQGNKQPTPTDHRLRLNFWMEYERVQARREAQMNMSNVLAGICSKEFFYAKYLKHAHKCAWLLCVPTGYETKAAEALEYSIDQLRDILELPHVLPGGKFDSALAAIKLKIHDRLHVAKHGAPVQRNLNVNVNDNTAIAKATTASTMEDMQKQLKDLERANHRAKNLPQVIEVEGQGRPISDHDESS